MLRLAKAPGAEAAKQKTTGKAEQVPAPPLAIIEAWLSDASVTLPFDRDPGTAERFTELWAKAFKEVGFLASFSALFSLLSYQYLLCWSPCKDQCQCPLIKCILEIRKTLDSPSTERCTQLYVHSY